MLSLVSLLGLGPPVLAEAPRPPSRQVPSSVMVELRELENRFELALSADCDALRCFSKGCTYVDHAVADRPRSGSMPGLGLDPGPGSVEAQAWLTGAECAFAHEPALESGDVQALVRRLQAKVNGGWTAVSIDAQSLQTLPGYLRDPPEPEKDEDAPPEEVPAPEPEDWATMAVAGREAWTTLLPHAYWMIGLFLVTVLGTVLIWAFRRVGQPSFEERALLAELAQPRPPEPVEAEPALPAEVSDADDADVETQAAQWASRLEAMDPAHPDPELQALVRDLLRARELPLLAKAVLCFPKSFLAAFPEGGEIAGAKLELAAYLKAVDEAALPSDAEFYASLKHHALSAALAAQGDARLIRSLQEDFGAAGLVDLIGRYPPRVGALFFALAPAIEQHEMVRLLPPHLVAQLAEQLLRSNRMDSAELAFLLQVLEAVRLGSGALPAAVAREVTDRGSDFDAAGALSTLLPALDPRQRAALFGAALHRFNGTLPEWYRGIFVADMLFELGQGARADLMLEVDSVALAAWLSVADPDTATDLRAGLPDSLRAALSASSVFPSRSAQLALAARARHALARAFQQQLAREDIDFARVVQAAPAEDA